MDVVKAIEDLTENKKEIVLLLEILLKSTRAGSGIRKLVINEAQDRVLILFDTGCAKNVNIAADSGIAIIADIIAAL